MNSLLNNMYMYNVEWKKSNMREYILYDSLFMRFQNSQKQSTMVEVKTVATLGTNILLWVLLTQA